MCVYIYIYIYCFKYFKQHFCNCIMIFMHADFFRLRELYVLVKINYMQYQWNGLMKQKKKKNVEKIEKTICTNYPYKKIIIIVC